MNSGNWPDDRCRLSVVMPTFDSAFLDASGHFWENVCDVSRSILGLFRPKEFHKSKSLGGHMGHGGHDEAGFQFVESLVSSLCIILFHLAPLM